MDAEKASRKAAAARRILEDPAYQEAVNQVKEAIVAQLENCPIKDDDLKQKLVTMLQLHKQYQRVLWNTVESGRVADEMLKNKSLFNRKGI